MKNTIAFFLFNVLLLANPVFGQDHLDVLTNAACECIEGKELAGKSEEDLQMELGVCILQSLSKIEGNGIDSLGIDMTDQNAMYKLGESIGIRMATMCPATLMKVVSSSLNELVPEEEPEESFLDLLSNEVMGTITEVGNNEITTLTLEMVDGSILKMAWLGPFVGSEQYTEDPTTLMNKKVKMTYDEVLIYSNTVKDYVKRKEILSLEVVE